MLRRPRAVKARNCEVPPPARPTDRPLLGAWPHGAVLRPQPIPLEKNSAIQHTQKMLADNYYIGWIEGQDGTDTFCPESHFKGRSNADFEMRSAE